MNQVTFDNLVNSTLDKCKSTLTSKRDEYVNDPDKDVLANFYNNAELSIVGTPEGIAWELLTKHLQSIKDYCSGRSVSSNVLDEKVGDAINYLLLIKGIISERDIENNGFKPKFKLQQLVRIISGKHIRSTNDESAFCEDGELLKISKFWIETQAPNIMNTFWYEGFDTYTNKIIVHESNLEAL